MVALELEIVLNRSVEAARKARHRFVTPEHLLLQLLDRKAVVRRLEANCATTLPRRPPFRLRKPGPTPNRLSSSRKRSSERRLRCSPSVGLK
jgi:hypothetical protein